MEPSIVSFLVCLCVVVVWGLVVTLFRGRSKWLAEDSETTEGGAEGTAASQSGSKSKVANSLALLKKTYARNSSTSMKLHKKDGSVTFTETEESVAPPALKTLTVVAATPIVNITTSTKVLMKVSLTTTTSTTLKNSNNVLALSASMRKHQVKVKAMASFLQVAVQVGFNSDAAFPGAFSSATEALKGVVNLDIAPALGLEVTTAASFSFGIIP